MQHRIATAAAALVVTGAAIAGPHEHGIGHLDVAVDGSTLVIELRLPTEDLVGFERAPRTDAERARIEHRRVALGDATLFSPSPEAKCTPVGTPAVEPPVFGKPAGGAEEHADFAATYRFECANATALAALEHGIFKAFPRIKQLRVQAVTAKGQKRATLTHGKPRLSF